MLADILANECVAPTQHNLLQQQLDESERKQKIKEEVLVYYFFLRPFVLPLIWLARPFYRGLKASLNARLGNLNQYPPRELQIPANYYKKIPLANAPKISIVTPSFNQSEFIERTLKSVLDQSYPSLEFYVQDGGSSDGTLGVLRRYSDHLTGWASCQDNGQSHAINVGFNKSSGEIMAWLNSDDILLPGALDYVAEYFIRHPDVDVVYGHRLLINHIDQQIGRWMMPAHDDTVLSWADFIPQETMFWRRSIWEKSGGRIDETFQFAMDWDLLLRFREAGACFVRLPRFLGGFRIHPQQKTSAVLAELGVQEMSRLRQRALGRIPLRKEIGKAIRPYLLRHVATDLGWRIRNKLGFG